MKQIVCAVYDRAQQAYMNPVHVPHTGLAIRSFTDEVNRKAPDNQLHNHASDFELWRLAEFDTEEGTFVMNQERLARAEDVKQQG